MDESSKMFSPANKDTAITDHKESNDVVLKKSKALSIIGSRVLEMETVDEVEKSVGRKMAFEPLPPKRARVISSPAKPRVYDVERPPVQRTYHEWSSDSDDDLPLRPKRRIAPKPIRKRRAPRRSSLAVARTARRSRISNDWSSDSDSDGKMPAVPTSPAANRVTPSLSVSSRATRPTADAAASLESTRLSQQPTPRTANGKARTPSAEETPRAAAVASARQNIHPVSASSLDARAARKAEQKAARKAARMAARKAARDAAQLAAICQAAQRDNQRASATVAPARLSQWTARQTRLPQVTPWHSSARSSLYDEDDSNWKHTQRKLDKMFEKQSRKKFNKIAPFSMPDGFKEDVQLYGYQQDGIRWLAHQEQSNKVGPFWEKKITPQGQRWYYCTLTRRRQTTRPEPCALGSILADEMGVGKTIQAIGLMLSNPGCNLIVCPVSVIANWKLQIEQFVKPGVWNVAVYYGPKRHKELRKVKRGKVDILLTSYETLVSDSNQHDEMLAELAEEKKESKHKAKKARREEVDEVVSAWNGSNDDNWQPHDCNSDDENDHILPRSILKKRKRRSSQTWIFDLHFHRIVLDEAHIVRNNETGRFKSVMKIQAERKLCLTGTPFVNRPSDIHSLLAFLRAKPLSEPAVFDEYVVKPISKTREIGLARIRTVMSRLSLRRTKAAVDGVIELPPKQVTLHSVEWPEGNQKSVHEILYETARAAFVGLLRGGSKCVHKNYFAMLVLVLRVRQACCDTDLVPLLQRLLTAKIHREGIDLGAVEGADLLNKLRHVFEKQGSTTERQDESAENYDNECAVCLDELLEDSAVVLRSCKHVLCEDCLNRIPNHLCPLCRTPYRANDMVKKNVALEAANSGREDKECSDVAPKVQALLGEINKMAKDEKAVIFSQWTKYLDVIQAELSLKGHRFTRIDGTMKATERVEAMEEFSSDEGDSPRFILCSLKACGTGINLTRGNVVFMMDIWWNYACENQAMDRVHRIGQTRNVRVVRFVMKNSIEERMVNLQDAKTALGKGSLQKLSRKEREKARITALKDLFEVEEAMIQNWEGDYEDEDM